MGTATFLTNAGKAITTARIKGTGTEPSWVAVGVSGGRTALVTDTALTSQAETRTSGTSTLVTTSVTNDTYQVVGLVTATAPRAIDEAALFDAATAGNMYMSATFATINLAANDSIQMTMKVQYA